MTIIIINNVIFELVVMRSLNITKSEKEGYIHNANDRDGAMDKNVHMHF